MGQTEKNSVRADVFRSSPGSRQTLTGYLSGEPDSACAVNLRMRRRAGSRISMFQECCGNSRAKSRARSPNIAITSSRAVASLGRSTAYLLAFEPWEIRISYVGMTATSRAVFLGSAAKQIRTSRLRNRHRSTGQGQQRYRHDQLSHHGLPSWGSPHDHGDGKLDHKLRQASRFV
jgi:hypothetical protein